MHSAPWFTRKVRKSNFVLLIPVKSGCGPGFAELHSVPEPSSIPLFQVLKMPLVLALHIS